MHIYAYMNKYLHDNRIGISINARAQAKKTTV